MLWCTFKSITCSPVMSSTVWSLDGARALIYVTLLSPRIYFCDYFLKSELIWFSKLEAKYKDNENPLNSEPAGLISVLGQIIL